MLLWSSLYINWNIIGIASSAPPRRVAGLRLERRRSVTVHPASHKNTDAQKSHHFSWFPTGFLSDILSCTNHACSQTHRSPISQGNKQLGSFAVGKNLTSRGTCRKRLTLLPNLSSLKMPAGYQHKISHRTYISNISTVKRPLRYHAVLWCKYFHLLGLCLTSSWILSRLETWCNISETVHLICNSAHHLQLRDRRKGLGRLGTEHVAPNRVRGRKK